jgi:DNA-binding ferritin-like protein (Dps family)
MRGLTKFVDEYKGFMIWLKGTDKDPNEYVSQFEKIFSVTTETELLREIQDMKDELNMLSAVFNDQKSVLKKVGENIKASRKSLLAKARDSWDSKSKNNAVCKLKDESTSKTDDDSSHGSKDGSASKSNNNSASQSKHASSSDHSEDKIKSHLVETSLSAFSFQQQSDKHAKHIKRMQDQANQAYNNVSVSIP